MVSFINKRFVTALISLIVVIFQNTAFAKSKKITGQAHVQIAEDFQAKKSQMIYLVEDETDKKFYKLKFKTGEFPMWFQTGKKVQIEIDEAPSGGESEVLNVTMLGEAAAAYVTDSRAILILRVTMSDGVPYASRDSVASYMFAETNSVARYFLDNTRGKTTFNGDVGNDGAYDIHDVSINASAAADCNYSSWGSLADQQAQSIGLSLSLYRHVMYILPSNTNCGWLGLASLGGSRSWIKGGSQGVLAHELGHNLGMHHASTDPENDGTINSEYGDQSCVMGSAYWRFLNAPHMTQLGTFSAFPNQVVNVTTGTYQLSSLSADPETAPHPQVLRIQKGTGSEYYYFSLRTPFSYDATLSSTYTRGVSVHRFVGGRSYYIKTLAPDESFEDSTNGIVVTAQSFSSDMQSIGVSVGVVCGSSAPTLTLSPSQVFGIPNSNTQVTWTLRNNDNSYCAATNFSLAGSSADGLSVGVSSSSVSLAPGASVSGNLSLSTANSSGSYSFSLVASDSDGVSPDHINVSANGSFTIDLTAPSSVSNLSASIARSNNVNLTWSAASDSGSGVASYEVLRNGVRIGSSTYAGYTDSGLSVGTYVYTVVSVDRSGNRSQPSNAVTVEITTKKRGGGKPSR